MKAYKDEFGNIIFNEASKNIHQSMNLPCGQCMGCRLNHAEGWAIRMVHEAQLHEENCFLTLTYNDENLPPNGSLRYEDVTKFIKKLRKVLQHTKYKIKYYRVGEYGDQLSRPHYHIILFGFDFTAKLRYRGEENLRTEWRAKNGRIYYVSSLLSKLWGLGHAEIGEVNYTSCMYVAKYVTKKVNGPTREQHYQRVTNDGEIVPVEQEKASMSRRNAIGKDWLEKYWSDVYPDDSCIHETRRLKTPKYYDKWLEKNNPQLYQEIKINRETNGKTLSQDDLTRIYHSKVLTSSNYIREYDNTKNTNEIDQKILQYRLDEAITLHTQRKEKLC